MTAMLSLLALPVLAQTYVGIKGGPLNISRDIPFDDGAMMGCLVGYDVPDNNFSVEGEFNTTVSSAEGTRDDFGDLDVTTLAFYGVYRSSGRFYFKGKAGLLYEYLNSSVTGIITIDVEGSAIALSFGIGGGMRISEKLSAEIEYTSIEADIGYATAGLNWMF
jgi:hypothetical protein